VENLGVTPKVPFIKLHCVEEKKRGKKKTHDAVDVRGGIARKGTVKDPLDGEG
jgi:hypothetical protein